MSRVHTAAARPYFVRFSRAMTSWQNYPTRNHPRYGAKDFLPGDFHFVVHVGEDGGAYEVAAIPNAISSAGKGGALTAP